jgi:hypothetical protein
MRKDEANFRKSNPQSWIGLVQRRLREGSTAFKNCAERECVNLSKIECCCHFFQRNLFFAAEKRVYYTLVFSVRRILQMLAHAAVNAGSGEKGCFLTLL